MQYSLSMFWANRLTYYCLESFVLCESLIKHSKTCGECFKEREREREREREIERERKRVR